MTPDVADNLNSTTSPLTSGGTWTGEKRKAVFPFVGFTLATDQDGELTFQLSDDGENFYTVGFYYYRAGGVNRPHQFKTFTRYYKLSFTNTSSEDQTYLRLFTYQTTSGELTAPANGTFVRDADTNVVMPLNNALALSRGQFDGRESSFKFGQNKDVDSAAGETLWSVGGVWTPIVTPRTLSIVSSSTQDDTGGSGATEVTVYGVLGSGLKGTEVVTLDGQTPVVTTNTWKGVNRIKVTDGATNVGNITATATTEGTVQGYIEATYGITQQMIFTVADNEEAYIDRIYWSTSKTGGSSPIVTFEFYQILDGVTYRIFEQTIDVSSKSDYEVPFKIPYKLSAGSQWYMEVETNTNNTVANGILEQTLVDINT